MENGLLLSFPHHHQTKHISFFNFFPQPQLHFPKPRPAYFHFQFITSPHYLCFPLIATASNSATRSRRWDSNAETFPQKFNQQDDEDDDDQEEEEEESFYGKNLKGKKHWGSKNPKMKYKRSWNVLDEAIESVWILKVIF